LNEPRLHWQCKSVVDHQHPSHIIYLPRCQIPNFPEPRGRLPCQLKNLQQYAVLCIKGLPSTRR
jgi:hypothetical protein